MFYLYENGSIVGKSEWPQEGWVELADNHPDVVEFLSPKGGHAALSARQFRLGLHANGLLSSVQAGIDAMEEPDRTAAQIEWEYATQIERNHPLLVNLAAQLELSEEQIDAMWSAAAEL